MPKQLTSKPCATCGNPVAKIKRTDRKAFYYPKRCLKCQRMPSSPEITERRRQRINAFRVTHPIGTTRLQNCGGFVYRLIKVDTSRRWKYEHRVIAEAQIGRSLNPGEIVHHVNHDTLDNRPENLVVMTSANHTTLHHSIASWSKKYKWCIDCNRSDRRHEARGMCYVCYQRFTAKLRGHWPTRKQ
jgi:hypothetical protein